MIFNRLSSAGVFSPFSILFHTVQWQSWIDIAWIEWNRPPNMFISFAQSFWPCYLAFDGSRRNLSRWWFEKELRTHFDLCVRTWKAIQSAENLFFNIYFQFFPLSFYSCLLLLQRRNFRISKHENKTRKGKNLYRLFFLYSFCLFLSPRWKKGMKHERNRKFSNLFSPFKRSKLQSRNTEQNEKNTHKMWGRRSNSIDIDKRQRIFRRFIRFAISDYRSFYW